MPIFTFTKPITMPTYKPLFKPTFKLIYSVPQGLTTNLCSKMFVIPDFQNYVLKTEPLALFSWILH